MKMNTRNHRIERSAAVISLILPVLLLGAALSGCSLLFPVSYTVTFDSMGGSVVAPAEKIKEGALLPVPTAPTKDGYAFDGWYTDDSFTTAWNFGSDTVTTATTLYAQWTANTDTDYTVEHYQQDVSGGGYTKVTADTESLAGTTSTTATATAKTYTGFREHTTHADRVASGTIAGDGSLVLKLYYDRDTFTVSYDVDGGSSVSETTGVRYEATISEPTAPTKDGYAFDGWYTDDSFTTAWNFDSDTVTTATTLYVQWTADSHTLSFNSNGGTGTMTDMTLETDEQATLNANAFTREGYAFVGWARSAGGTAEYEDEDDYTMGTEDDTLYAVWEEEELGVGDLGPAGGYIFYDDTVGFDFNGDSTISSDEKDLLDGTNDGNVTGDRYLEAAPYGWYNEGDDPSLLWGGKVFIAGISAGKGVGAGETNTAAIVSTLGGSARAIGTPDYAALACFNYSKTVGETVYDDWFLPSKDELNLMYRNLYVSELGELSDAVYWASSAQHNNIANAQVFMGHPFNGAQTSYDREEYPRNVRPVRAF